MSSADRDEWLARYEQERQAAERTARRHLHYAAEFLRLVGVEEVVARFDGSGDEGFVQGVEYHPEPPAGVPDGVRELIEDAVCELLPGGWEINAGSFGSVTFDTRTGEPFVEHTWREEEDFDEDGLDDGEDTPDGGR